MSKMDADEKHGHQVGGENSETDMERKRKDRYKGAAFMAGVTGISILFGFSTTLTMAKKKDPTWFDKGLIGSRGVPESGGALALRALGWGTLYAVSGVGILSFAVWKLIGVHSMEEFRQKMQGTLPSVPQPANPGRNEFGSVKELVDFLIDDGNSEKPSKS